MASGAIAYFGFQEMDLVLLAAGGVAALAILVGLAGTLIVVFRIRLALARRAAVQNERDAQLECTFAERTDFELPRTRWLPWVRVRWEWTLPKAEVRVLRRGKQLVEEVKPYQRASSDRIVRRFTVADTFGLSALSFDFTQELAVRVLPGTGRLGRMPLLATLTGGADIPDPAGIAEGDRVDIRNYNPGDPIRFVLWKVYARTRQLMVRTPERAVSTSRRTLAYLVTGAGDEPAAGAARVAVDSAALGGDWAFGADGADEPVQTKEAAMDIVAKSAHADRERAGGGLKNFLDRAGSGSGTRALIFVPGIEGPWIEPVLRSVSALRRDGAGRAPIEFVVCTDGVKALPSGTWIERVLMRNTPDRGASDATTSAREIKRLAATLGAGGARVWIVDRRDGHVQAATR